MTLDLGDLAAAAAAAAADLQWFAPFLSQASDSMSVGELLHKLPWQI